MDGSFTIVHFDDFSNDDQGGSADLVDPSATLSITTRQAMLPIGESSSGLELEVVSDRTLTALRIVGITEGSPAEQCNTLKIGDIIVKANDKVIPKSLPHQIQEEICNCKGLLIISVADEVDIRKAYTSKDILEPEIVEEIIESDQDTNVERTEFAQPQGDCEFKEETTSPLQDSVDDIEVRNACRREKAEAEVTAAIAEESRSAEQCGWVLSASAMESIRKQLYKKHEKQWELEDKLRMEQESQQKYIETQAKLEAKKQKRVPLEKDGMQEFSYTAAGVTRENREDDLLMLDEWDEVHSRTPSKNIYATAKRLSMTPESKHSEKKKGGTGSIIMAGLKAAMATLEANIQEVLPSPTIDYNKPPPMTSSRSHQDPVKQLQARTDSLRRTPNDLLSESVWKSLMSNCPQGSWTQQRSLLFSFVRGHTQESTPDVGNLLQACGRVMPSLIIIKTTKSVLLGAYLSNPWSDRYTTGGDGFFGNMSCFVFRYNAKLDPCFKAWPGVSGPNFMCARDEHLCIGVGERGFALELKGKLLRGYSYPSTTYANEPLAHNDHAFEINAIQAWGFGAEAQIQAETLRAKESTEMNINAWL
eukprot:m.97913 g.97913  ORF g.97913 m.97913 type:complete len:590 (-) comp13617_c0_seq3:707-2476(-)